MVGKPLKILFLTYQGGLAGSTFSIVFLAKGLADRGHQVFAGLRKEMPIWDLIEHPGITRVPMRFRHKFDAQNWRQIRDLVRTHGIQVINAQSSIDRYNSISAKIRWGLSVQVVHTRRQNPLGSIGYLQRLYYTRNTAGIIVISEGLKRIFVKQGYPADHLKVIYNGIPKSRLAEWSGEKVSHFEKTLKIQKGDKVIGCVSRLKEQSQLIEAISKMNDPNIKLVFAGVSEEAIRPYLQKFNIKNETYVLGNIPPEDILSLYRVFDVNVLPSTMDGFGLVLIEAMAMECPVVATNFGGIADVIENGENGLLFENKNIPELIEKLRMVLEDESLCNKLIKNGMKTAFEKFTMEKTVEAYEEYFTELANRL